MIASASVLGILLALCQGVASETSSSFLKHRLQTRSHGDWDETEVKLFTFDTESGFDRTVKVFADSEDNTRYVQFGRPGYIDDGFIESMVKCKGTLPKSCLDKSPGSTCPCELDLKHTPYGLYQKHMLELLAPYCSASESKHRILLVGLGGGALAQHIQGRCSQTTEVDAVEYDPRMIKAASQFFGLRPTPGKLTVSQGDGGAVVAARAKAGQRYDVVLVDAFAGGPHVPESCRNTTFINNLHRLLKPGGLVVHNIKVDYQQAFPLYQSSFGNSAVSTVELRGGGELPSQLIVAKMPN